MFGAAEEEDLDFNPAAGSKLASLFSLDHSHGKGNSSLTYTAPKQPRSHHLNDDGSLSPKRSSQGGNSVQSSSKKLSLIVVKTVTSFKLEDKTYNHQGKLGLALLGNAVSRLFQVLLYKGKQNQITTARISPNFQFTVQPHLYASFYDDRMQNWSVMFESKDDAMDFTTQVAIARYRAATEETLICQELLPGTDPCFHEGETVELKLAAQPFTIDSIQAVDLRQSVIRCTVAHELCDSGWAAGLLGSAPGAIRIIIAPLATQIPWLSSKRNEPLLVEVNISRPAKTSGDNSTLPPSVETNCNKSGASASGIDSAVDSSAEDSSVRARGASIKEALSNSPRSNKASIISRMARMGQATLPLKGAVACNPSDSEETEEDSRNNEGNKQLLKTRAGKSRSSSSSLRQQASPIQTSPVPSSSIRELPPGAVTVVQTPVPWNQHQQNIMRTGSDGSVVQIVTSEGQLVSLGSQPQHTFVAAQSGLISPSDPTPHLSMFLSESRMHNTEMRMHFGKFADKLDQLMTKVDNMQQPSTFPGCVSSAGTGLEPTVLLSSIEKIVKENQALQIEVEEKNKRLDEQNERIFSLLSTNSKFLEQSSSLFEQKQLQEQQQQKQEQLQMQQEQQLQLIQQMRDEKVSLGNQLSSLQNQLTAVQELVQALQKSNCELNQELETTRLRLQEKEKLIREIEVEKTKSEGEEKKFQDSLALNELQASNAKLQEQVLEEISKFESEKKSAEERIRSLEQQHKCELSLLKEQLNKNQEVQYMKTIRDLEDECKILKRKLQDQSKPDDNILTSLHNSLILDIKLLMNTMYRGLNQQFSLGQSYEGGEIRALIAKIVKTEALQFVNKIETLKDSPGSMVEHSKKIESKTEPSTSNTKETKDLTHLKPNPEGPANSFVIPSLGEETVKKTDLNTQYVNKPPAVSQNQSKVDSEETNSAKPEVVPSDNLVDDSSSDMMWRPLPPPPPLFHDDEDSDDWLS